MSVLCLLSPRVSNGHTSPHHRALLKSIDFGGRKCDIFSHGKHAADDAVTGGVGQDGQDGQDGHLKLSGGTACSLQPFQPPELPSA